MAAVPQAICGAMTRGATPLRPLNGKKGAYLSKVMLVHHRKPSAG